MLRHGLDFNIWKYICIVIVLLRLISQYNAYTNIILQKTHICMSYYSIHSCMHTIWPFQLWLGVGRSKLLVDNNCRTSYKLSLVCIISRWNCGWLVLLCKICCRYTYIRRYRTTVLCMNEFNMLFMHICMHTCSMGNSYTHTYIWYLCSMFIMLLLCQRGMHAGCEVEAHIKGNYNSIIATRTRIQFRLVS